MCTVNRRIIKIVLILVTIFELGRFIFDSTWNSFVTHETKVIQSRDYTQNYTMQYQLAYFKTLKNMSIMTTVVTAYFDLGTFRKGSAGKYFTRQLYYDWAKTFRFLANPLVVYTDSEDFRKHMMFVRNESMKHTKIFLIPRSSSWAFENIERIKQIFSFEDYPKHYPNTVVPAYTCAQHAKFDMIERAAKTNVFNTKYYMWLDVGYFRDRKSQNRFYLSKPKGFDDSKIAMNLIKFKHSLSTTPDEIMKKNRVLVGGGLVYGERQNIINFAVQFRRAVVHFLSVGLINTDQQVIYAMFSKLGRQNIKPEIELQIYRPGHEDDWFYLGNAMVKEIHRNNCTKQGIRSLLCDD